MRSQRYKRRKILNNLFKQSKSYKKTMIIYYILLVLAAIILITFLFLVITSYVSVFTVFVFVLIGLLFAFIPFIIATAVKRKTLIKATMPYGIRTYEKISFDECGIWYSYLDDISDRTVLYRIGRNIEHEHYLHRYYIEYSNIQNVKIKNDICNITGNILYYFPNVYENTSYDKNYEEKKNFSFLMAFEDDVNQKIKQLGGTHE